MEGKTDVVVGRCSPGDPSSYSRPDQVKVTDIFLQLSTNFEEHVLEGDAILSATQVDPSASSLCLDSRNLAISSVTLLEGSLSLPFTLKEESNVGSKLEISLPPGTPQSFKVKITYRTEKDCSALQWLSPQQTAGKTHPYMFSQCQAIHCRSMVPCQDTPSVKATYSAEITAPEDLTVLMSAVRQGERPTNDGRPLKTTTFVQKIPIQSYLIAIVAGRLEHRDIGPRSKVWCEKEYIEVAASDFSETETMIKTAEDLCGPYVWGVYDILVLPPSFPFGGMENPCLTFVTPTLLTGDKSLTDVVAHEISHSWSGNLVTNSNFEHFWLNEGFTMFIERKIKGRMEKGGEALRHFEGIGGWKRLQYGIDVLGEGNPLTDLVPDLTGVDPDDAFSVVPYEKGFVFLWYLEELVGGPTVFEPFLRGYIDTFKYKSIDSDTFKNHIVSHFPQLEKQVAWVDWFHKPGMPIYKPNYDRSLVQACEDLKDKVLAGIISLEFNSLTVGQKLEFLNLLLETKVPVSIMEKMRDAYGLKAPTNAEIKFLWIRLGLKNKWVEAVDMALAMIKEQGRMKFTRPLYRDLYASEETRELALKTFSEDKPNMMLVSIQGVERDLKLR